MIQESIYITEYSSVYFFVMVCRFTETCRISKSILLNTYF